MHTHNRKPAYIRQKSPDGNDRAFVKLKGRRVYLGDYDSPESREAYKRTVAEFEAQFGRSRPIHELCCAELAIRYLRHAEEYFRGADGKPTSSIHNVKAALKPLKELYASWPASKFDVIAFKAARQWMIGRGWNRGTVNKTANILRSVFRWGQEEGLVPEGTWDRLQVVASLKLGRTKIPEGERVHPVDLADVETIKPFLSPVVASMVDVQRLTGMRPGEVCTMRAVDIDMKEDVWLYRPLHHKTSYRDKNRVVFIGPKAQEVVKPYLAGRPVNAYLFSPREAQELRAELAPTHRRPGQAPNPRLTARRVRDRYDSTTYCRAIEYACAKAWPAPGEIAGDPATAKQWRKEHPGKSVPKTLLRNPEAFKQWKAEHKWNPNQLRHTYATKTRKQFGLDGAQVMLGHSDADITQVYAEADITKGMEIARKIG